MCPYVYLQASSLCAGVIALFANKGFLSTVNQHVFLQINSTDARVAALVATVGLLSIMLKQVPVEVFGHLEGEIALIFFILHFHDMISVQLVLLRSIREQS